MMKKWVSRILIAGVIIALTVAACYFYFQYQNLSGKSADREIRQLVAKVGKIMLLPDELPTLATVTDKSKLSGQKFFRNAENNDKVLIFSMASKAILFRPRENRIIEVASVTMTDQPQTINLSPTAGAAKTSEKIGVELYNGTSVIGLTQKYESSISGKFPNVVILGKETAKKTNYTQTVVVDITGRSPQVAKDIADSLGAKLESMPVDENAPVADILVILGKNSN